MENKTPPQKPLTVEEAKDEAAKKYKTRQNKELNSWEEAMSEYCKGYLLEDILERIIHEAILLYHTSQKESETDSTKNAFEAGRKRISHPDFDYVYETFEDYIKSTKKQ